MNARSSVVFVPPLFFLCSTITEENEKSPTRSWKVSGSVIDCRRRLEGEAECGI